MHSSRTLLEMVGSDLRNLNSQMLRSRSTAVRTSTQPGSTFLASSTAMLTSPSAVELLWSAPIFERRSSLGTGTSARVRSISSAAATHASDAANASFSTQNFNSQLLRASTPTPIQTPRPAQLQTQFSSDAFGTGGLAFQTQYSANGAYSAADRDRGRRASEQFSGSSTKQSSPPLQPLLSPTSGSSPHSATFSARAFPLSALPTSAAVSFVR